MHGNDYKVFNAFIMPYSGVKNSIENIGVGISNWKSNEKTYENIQGILLDVKHLMKVVVSRDETELQMMAECIENSLAKTDLR